MESNEPNRSCRKLLIVDDSPEMRGLLRRLLSETFAEIRECADGDQAIAAFDDQRPDYVLMDIAMPGRDGLSATACILARNPAARIFIVSQHDAAPFHAAAAQAGAYGFVSKTDLQPLREYFRLEQFRTGAPSSDGAGAREGTSPPINNGKPRANDCNTQPGKL